MQTTSNLGLRRFLEKAGRTHDGDRPPLFGGNSVAAPLQGSKPSWHDDDLHGASCPGGGYGAGTGWIRTWAEQIVASAAIRPGELVVDLGAGDGALTLPLLDAGARVIAVELHAGRMNKLRAKVGDHSASVVRCDLEDFVAPGRPFRLVANPPYAMTGAVLPFAARSRYLMSADLVLQRAVVRRVVVQGRRELRRFHARRGLSLPRNAFVPPPNVDSAVLQLRRRRWQ